ncbi:MAG: glycosyltransferase [Rhodothermaceae bacterium]|nr:glycosyltransferase [Rhodothermaceae bacterium]
MIKIVVNAVSLRSAGGRSVAINFLRAANQSSRDFLMEVFAPADSGYEDCASPRIRIHIVPDWINQNWLRPVTDEHWLTKRIDDLAPDVIFSMGNFSVPSSRKQVVLFMWPYATYPEGEIWDRMSWKDVQTRKAKIATFRKRLKYADVVAPQTQTSAERLKRYYPEIKELCVVPTAVALNQFKQPLSGEGAAFDWSQPGNKLLCLTRYYPHKNLEILVELARLIKFHEKPYSVITTIADEQHVGAAQLIEQIKQEEVQEVIHNIGPVPMDEVPALYEQTDGLLLPTLLESFSGTYVDAMFMKKPIFTSDRDFARDVCGEAAFYFDPLSAGQILEVIESGFNDPDRLQHTLDAGYTRVSEFPDWNKVADMYLDLLERTAASTYATEANLL